jgi:membrane-associated protease RseP (regulator of RpoE activity)
MRSFPLYLLSAAALAVPQTILAQASLGASLSDVVAVASVNPGGPAAAAGLQPGDVILEIDGKKVDRTGDVRPALNAARPGIPLSLKILRAGRTMSLTAPQPAARPGTQALAQPPAAAGSAGSDRGKFSLKAFEGYMFDRHEVVESCSKVDFTLTWQLRVGVVTYLGAPKIKFFGETRPDIRNITKAEIETWKDYVMGVGMSYHLLKTSGNKYYLVRVDSFKDLGKAPTFWRVDFSYEEIEPRR